MSFIAPSASRARLQTDPDVNRRITRETAANIAWFANHPDQIDARLRELDEEWDLERYLQLSSAVVSLATLVLAMFRGKRWLLLTLAVQGFFLQHSLQGWCPPLPPLRRAGVRTEDEIAAERHALKALRGDFENAAENPIEHAERS